jgi:hypothetical protein
MKKDAPNTLNTWQDPLKAAFKRSAVIGLFIDYQRENLEIGTREAFFNGAKIVDILRKSGVPNFWAAHLDDEIVQDMQPYKNIKLRNDSDFTIATPMPDEIVITKQRPNVLTNPKALTFVKSCQTPTIVLGGVYGYQCYASTLTSLLYTIDCDVIAPYNATNFETTDEIKSLLDDMEWNFKKCPKGRLHVTTTENLVNTLPDILSID